MNRLVLVRHGETDFNRAHKLQGQTDTQLNAAGLQQAKQVALALRSERFDAIWSSPLQRALKTAELISEHHPAPLMIKPILKERSFGQLEGQTVSQIRALEAAQGAEYGDATAPGVESWSELKNRASQVFRELQEFDVGDLLIVAHAGIFRALIGVILQLDINEWRSLPQHNTCINTFIYNENSEIVAHSLNDHEHCL
jgi:broad specificity phosphatase PhoE